MGNADNTQMHSLKIWTIVRTVNDLIQRET